MFHVALPKLAKRFYNYNYIFWLRHVVALLSFLSFVYCLVRIFINRKLVFSLSNFDEKEFYSIFFIVLIIFMHVNIYALCSAVINRHAYPIAPLFLILIAYSLNNLLGRCRKRVVLDEPSVFTKFKTFKRQAIYYILNCIFRVDRY